MKVLVSIAQSGPADRHRLLSTQLPCKPSIPPLLTAAAATAPALQGGWRLLCVHTNTQLKGCPPGLPTPSTSGIGREGAGVGSVWDVAALRC
eukprot:743217-Pelagomonas_calceolata.AAC.1